MGIDRIDRTDRIDPRELTASSRLKLQLGDIATMNVDAVVNSANPNLATGGPVHAAIHRAAGPELMAAVSQLDDCPPGQARITSGYQLAAPFVIHTVPPTWMDGQESEPEVLASCYRECLQLAAANRVRTLAFPSLGSGPMPQIPLEVAAPVAIGTILGFLRDHEFPQQVVLVCFTTATYQIHQKILKEALP